LALKLGYSAIAADLLFMVAAAFNLFVLGDRGGVIYLVLPSLLCGGVLLNGLGLLITIVSVFVSDAQRWRWLWPFLINVLPVALTWLLMLLTANAIRG
jgi:hypothetical protein